MDWINEFGIVLSVDEQGHVHKGRGPGGGQFTANNSESGTGVSNLAVFTGGSGKEGQFVTYHTTDKVGAESYVAMYNDRFGDGGSVHEKTITISNPAPWNLIRKLALAAGMDEDEVDSYTPASVFDDNLSSADHVSALVKSLKRRGYDGAILDDVPYGVQISDFKAYITFTGAKAQGSDTSTAPKPKTDQQLSTLSQEERREAKKLRADLKRYVGLGWDINAPALKPRVDRLTELTGSALSVDEHGRVHRDKGEGGGQFTSKSQSTETSTRISQIRKEASKIEVTDEVISDTDVDRRDYDEIESRMSDEDRSDMISYLARAMQDGIDEEMRSFEPEIDEKELAESLDLSRYNVEEKAEELFEKYELNAPSVSPSLYGTDAIQEVIDSLESDKEDINEDAYDQLHSELTLWLDNAQEEIDITEEKWRQEQVDEAEARARGDYDEEQDKREYLRQFYDDHPDLFATSTGEYNKWYKDSDGDGILTFETDSGKEYRVAAVYQTSSARSIPDMQFSDPTGSFKVTGGGEAMQVFSKVVPAIVAYIKGKDLPAATFSAAEPSRQRLYDRLVRTVASVMPDYFAVSVDKGTKRIYLIGKTAERETLLQEAKSLTSETPRVLVEGSTT